jgi:hypothetical protein
MMLGGDQPDYLHLPQASLLETDAVGILRDRAGFNDGPDMNSNRTDAACYKGPGQHEQKLY